MRKEITVTISEPGRDTGKTFHVTEMSAVRAEKWAERALGVMIRSGVNMPELLTASGFSGVVAVGFMGLFAAPFHEIEPLLDELLACVKAIPNPANPMIMRPLVESDTEEISTLVRLRMEVFELTSGFSVAAALSDLREMAAASANTLNTPISQDASEQ